MEVFSVHMCPDIISFNKMSLNKLANCQLALTTACIKRHICATDSCLITVYKSSLTLFVSVAQLFVNE